MTLDEQVEERPEVRARASARSSVAVPGLGVGVDDRELDLVLVGAEVHEQLVDGVEHLGRARVAAVDLVERDDHRQAARHRLLEHVARLRQRPLGRVDQQQHRVDHQQAALDLAAEVGVAGRVDDVQADAAVARSVVCLARIVMPFSRSRSLESITRSTTRLVGAEGAGLAEHRVDERGLAVVDVGDDGDVAQVVADGGGGGGLGRAGGHGWAGILVCRAAECRTGPPDARPRRVPRAYADPYAGAPTPGSAASGASDHAPVEQLEDAVGDVEHQRVVGRDHGRDPLVPDDRPEQQHDHVARLGVELAGRLVGEEELRAVGERPGDRDALLLAARQLVRPVLRPVRQPDDVEQLRDPRVALLDRLAWTSRSGTSTFSAAVRNGTSPNAWKMNATVLRRTSTSGVLAQRRDLEPSTTTVPAVGWSRPPSRLRSVVLPLPDRPRTASSSPRATRG